MHERDRPSGRGSVSVQSMLLQPGVVLPGGYEILEKIGAGGMGEVLLARSQSTGAKVAVKVLNGRSDAEPERFDREVRAAARIRHPNVVEFLDVGRTKAGMSFYVMEYLDGESLAATVAREGALPPQRACALTIQILQALEAAHQRGVIHRDLKPSNCLRLGTPGSETIKLLDFGIAKVSGEDSPETNLTRTGSVLGTPSYMSPEQAVGGQVDPRADIYSAGVILFELLTGQVPFTSSSPMGVLSRHINEEPPRPRQLAPEADISPELERIVLRALAKRPADRFERAAELAEALQDVLSQARRHELPAGTFRRPERLYGRGPERTALLEAFAKAVAGGRACVLLTGEAGVGKSAVVADVIGSRARVAYAKFDQHDPDARATALLGVFRQLAARVVTHDREVVMALRQDFEAELGLGLRVLVELVPELRAVVGPQPAPAPVGPTASRNRLHAALLRALRVFARLERPLVLFLDDLQWANPASVELLAAAAGEPDLEHLMVVATVRDDAVDPASGLGLALHELQRAPAVETVPVGPLHLEDVATLVADTLGTSPGEVEGLAREILRRTEGNPLFVHKLLREAHDAEILAYDGQAQCWRWRSEGLGDDRYADVSELIGSQLDRLPEATRALLAVAACVGPELEPALLTAVLEVELATLEERLRPAVALELVEPHSGLGGRSDGRHRFVHDRIRHAALSRADPAALPGLHLRIGRWLAAQGTGAASSSAVVHMIRGIPLVHDEHERRSLARQCLEAGRRARSTTDYEGARRFLDAGVSLIDAACWHDDHPLAFALHLEQAEHAYLAGDFDAADACYRALASRVVAPVEALELEIQRVTLDLSRGAPQQSIAIGLRALARHGLEVPASPRERAEACERTLERILRALEGRSIAELVDEPPCDDPVSRALLRLLTELIAPAHLTENELADLLICTLVELSLSRGSSEASAYGYVLFAFFLATRRPDPTAHAFGQLALALNERLGDPSQDSRLHFVFGSILHCFEPLSAALRHFERALVVGLESGDHVFASYACSHTLIALIGLGVPLPDVRERARQYLQVTGRTRVASSTAVVKLALRVVACLQGETEGPASLSDASFDEAAFVEEIEGASLGFSCLWYDVIKLQLLTLEGDLEGATQALERAERRRTNSAWFLSTELSFYRCMLLAARARAEADSSEPPGRPQQVDALREALRPIQRLAELCPQGYVHKELLVRAELAALEGRPDEALRLYDHAVVRARADGFTSTEALAAERAAACCQGLGYDGMTGMFAGLAEAAYLRWGAVGRAGAVRARYLGHIEGSGWPRAEQGPAEAREEAAGSPVGADLFARAIALSRMLADEDDVDRLAHRLLEHVVKATKTDRGMLAIERGGMIRIEASYASGDSDRSHCTPWPLDASGDAPMLPLKRAFWTGEMLLVDDIVDNARFANDTYLQRHRPRSILCLPLRAHGRRFGLLYLESRDSYAHFTPGLLDLLLMVTTQLAVSLRATRPDSSGRSSKHILPDDATRADA
ncbi:protein kinase domain-containing protein [Paraliomyxa miuraensis]|uniref:protein kinase domain-containing protein n=1 Tax=Paraliomyxa miuraensis TaxID=376150 RepID=UPI002259BA0E|nr:protein kinase [Paraliomyxa miuraensis]MCX4243107.1 protein kinase [Paraliomyxa miuraensis]